MSVDGRGKRGREGELVPPHELTIRSHLRTLFTEWEKRRGLGKYIPLTAQMQSAMLIVDTACVGEGQQLWLCRITRVGFGLLGHEA